MPLTKTPVSMASQPARCTTNSSRKMPALVVCFKCKKNVNITKTAMCCICKNRYEPNCDGYPEQTYRLMDQDSKNKWRCKTCIKKMAISSKDICNVTLRKKPACTTKKSLPETCIKKTNLSPPAQDSHVLTDYDTSYKTDTSPNKLSKSADGTPTNISTVSELQDTIAQLTAKLESTENELENRILENNDLNKQVNKLTAEIKVMKSLYRPSTIIESTPIKTDKKEIYSRFNQNVSSTPLSPRLTANTNTDPIHSHLQQKIIILQKELQSAEEEIKVLNTQIQELEQSLKTTSKPTSEPTSPTEIHPTSNLHQCLIEKTISIFGAQQCVGLAAALLRSRKSTQYER
ncbi:hypothetical protein SFRURICE_010541 [Spodoptera frugiperda]|nr:hypothetical protein SFRURICE_010541 [Spodoptera frugiperda]